MKRLIAAACALLCHVCANEVRMCDAISGRSPLCVVTATMPCSKKLSDESIKTIFDVQHLLFEQHEEYMPGLLGNYNWWSAEVQNALCEVYSEFDTLAIIRKTPKLIVFSENFFGRKIVRQKREFETLLKQHTGRFEDTIFAINYLCTEELNMTQKEILNIINGFNMNYMHNTIANIINIFKEKISRMFCIQNKNTMFSNYITRFESNIEAKDYLQLLHDQFKYSAENTHVTILENITSYFYKHTIIMRYNKATYCDEVQDLKIDNRNEYYLYKMGNGEDITQINNELAELLHNNVSTEICRDLFCAIKKDYTNARIHIIQSDTIDMHKYLQNIPICDIIIHSDSNNGVVYKYKNVQLIGISNITQYNINFQKTNCSIQAFMLV